MPRMAKRHDWNDRAYFRDGRWEQDLTSADRTLLRSLRISADLPRPRGQLQEARDQIARLRHANRKPRRKE